MDLHGVEHKNFIVFSLIIQYKVRSFYFFRVKGGEGGVATNRQTEALTLYIFLKRQMIIIKLGIN